MNKFGKGVKLPTLDEFLNEQELVRGLNQYDLLVKNICESGFLSEEENLILEFIYTHNLGKQFFEGVAPISLMESKLMQWIQDKGKQAVDAIKQGAEKAKDASVQLMSKIGQSFAAFVRYILEQVSAFLKKAWDYFKGKARANAAQIQDKLTEKIKTANIDPKQFKTEVQQFKDMATTGMTYFTGKVIGDMAAGMQKAGTEEVGGAEPKEKKPDDGNKEAKPKEEEPEVKAEGLQEIVVATLNEIIQKDVNFVKEILGLSNLNESDRIPGLSKLAHAIAKYPPFSWLHSIEDVVTEKTNNIFHKISIFLHEKTGAGGPYTFTLIGMIAGLAVGMKIEHGVVHVVQDLGLSAIGGAIASALPGIGTILLIMKWVAVGLAYVGIAEAVVASFEETGDGEKQPAH